MKIKWHTPGCCMGTILSLVLCGQVVMAQGTSETKTDNPPTFPTFGSPDSVDAQLSEDLRKKDSLTGVDLLRAYFDWKENVRKEHGFSYTLDYTAGFVGANNTISDEEFFSGGAVRFYGSWQLVGRESGNTGTFIWKGENRHKYAEIPPSGTASQVGYSGLMYPTLSNIGNRLTNLYWKQNLYQGHMEVIAGMIDVTDWLDMYALASPWTGFSNFAFATGGASIPTPDDATVGLYINGMLTDNLYLIGGIADSNADSTDPFNGFDTFFNENEYFTSAELGWTTSQDRFYLDNTHITYWHVDERVEAGDPSGWGVNFSFSHSFDEKWMPFFRAGYAKDGGSFLQKTVSAGLGYHWGKNNSLLGFGINWGQPNETTYSSGLDDQYTFELFSRLQVTQNIQITPDLQYIINPALNKEDDDSWVVGLRARVVF